MSFPLIPTDKQLYTTALGTDYQFDSTKVVWNIVSQEIVGNQGPSGPQGWQGPGNLPGAQGPTGPQGNQGNQGNQGPSGPQGYQGLGYQGPTGPQGFQGRQGPTGPQGFQGQGNQGSTGPQGNQGSSGPQGSQGYQGPTGPTGLANFTDSTGWPVPSPVPALMWNATDEALYAEVSEIGKWVQISAASLQGPQGLVGNYKRLYQFSVAAPVVGVVPGPRLFCDESCIRVSSFVTTGTNCTFNIQDRTTAPNTTGLNIMSVDQTAVTTNTDCTAFSNQILKADSWVFLNITGVTAMSGTLSVTLSSQV